MIRYLALKPKIRFAYFGRSPLSFHDFSDTAERVEKGIMAFDRADKAGWHNVERALGAYALMPATFTADPGAFFANIRRSVGVRRTAAIAV